MSGMKQPLSGMSGPVGEARPSPPGWPASSGLPQPRRPPEASSGSATRAGFWEAAGGPCPGSYGSAETPTCAGRAGDRQPVMAQWLTEHPVLDNTLLATADSVTIRHEELHCESLRLLRAGLCQEAPWIISAFPPRCREPKSCISQSGSENKQFDSFH